MADSKITALAALTAADPVNDMFPVVVVSDTSMAASGTTKRISANNILSSSPTASGALTITGLVTAGSASITGAATVGTTLGVTGVSTLASAVVTGDLTVDTSTLKVTASNNRVGVNTATPESDLDVRGLIAVRGTPTFPTTGVGPELFYSSGNSNSNLYSYNRSTSAWVEMAYGALTHKFDISGSTAMTLNASGNLAFGNGLGIDFAATASGSGTMTSELLNDYEEGTFTPTIIGATTAGVGVYTTQAGYYTKVGNLVTASVFLGWTAHTGTGNMYFAGLPFAASSSASYHSAASISYVNNIALTASNVLTLFITPGASSLEASQYPVGGGGVTNVPVDVSGNIIYTVTYRV